MQHSFFSFPDQGISTPDFPPRPPVPSMPLMLSNAMVSFGVLSWPCGEFCAAIPLVMAAMTRLNKPEPVLPGTASNCTDHLKVEKE
jgi:hypothetical protein